MIKTLLGIIMAGIFGGVTLFSGSTGVLQAVQTLDTAKIAVPEVQMVEAVSNSQPEVSPTSTTTPTPTPATSPARTKPAVNLALIPTPTPTPSSQASVGSGTGCIITLFGKQYDVTPLQTTHTGGNIFKCGTDMTAVYQAQHGTDVTRMQPYLVTNSQTGGGNPTPTPTPTPTGGPSVTPTQGGSGQRFNDDSDEDEQEAQRDRLENDFHSARDEADND